MSDQGITVTAQQPDPNELKTRQESAGQLLAEIEQLEIKSVADMERGAELLIKVKRLAEVVDDKSSEILRPLKEGVKKLEEMFKPVKTALSDAEKQSKDKITNYRDDVREQRKEQEEELLAKVDAGELTLDEAIATMQEEPALKKQIVTESGKVGSSVVKTVKVVDPSKLPTEYLVPNETAIRRDALGIGKDDKGNKRQPKSIPGVKVGWKESLRA